MTPINLQDDLVDELKRLFEPFLYKAPIGINDESEETENGSDHAFKRVPLNIYPQALPVQETQISTPRAFWPPMAISLATSAETTPWRSIVSAAGREREAPAKTGAIASHAVIS